MNQVTGKCYVGKTTGTLEKRFKGHIRTAKSGKGFYLHASIRQHGEKNFIPSILEECHIDQLDVRERYWIEFLGAHVTGYNLTTGGEGASGYKHSDECRDRMRDHHWSRTGTYTPVGRKLNESTRAAISEALVSYYQTHDHPAAGQPVDEQVRAKIAASRRGSVTSTEVIEKIASKNRGKRRSDDAKVRYALSKVGEKNPMFGRPAPNRKSVKQYTLTDEFINVFDSIKAAATHTGARTSAIRACCNGAYKSAGGFKWKFTCEVLDSEPCPNCSHTTQSCDRSLPTP